MKVGALKPGCCRACLSVATSLPCPLGRYFRWSSPIHPDCCRALLLRFTRAAHIDKEVCTQRPASSVSETAQADAGCAWWIKHSAGFDSSATPLLSAQRPNLAQPSLDCVCAGQAWSTAGICSSGVPLLGAHRPISRQNGRACLVYLAQRRLRQLRHLAATRTAANFGPYYPERHAEANVKQRKGPRHHRQLLRIVRLHCHSSWRFFKT